jgi:D-xylose reductase
MRYARYQPQVLQVEIHPYLTQEPLVKLCNIYDIAVTAYSSFGPQSYLELGAHKNVPSLFEHNVIVDIAKAHKKSGLHIVPVDGCLGLH